MDIGQPNQLVILRGASTTAWAGNQPFPVQPKLGLLDAGGNVVLGDSETLVHAFMTPSLGHSSQLIVDTDNSSVPKCSVTSVEFSHVIVNESKTIYAPGDVISIRVFFSQEVQVVSKLSNEGILPVLPSLELNIIENTTEPTYAVAQLFTENVPIRSRVLDFKYTVKVGHSQSNLDYRSTDSLKVNDCAILDGVGRDANLDLPPVASDGSLVNSKEISVDDSPAVITSITSTTSSGEYGAGQQIEFKVHFSKQACHCSVGIVWPWLSVEHFTHFNIVVLPSS